MSEHILWETIIADLERENRLLGERCNQLLKDKGNLIDELQELKETLAQTIENDEVAYETLKLHDQEEIGMLNSKIAGLEAQIEKMKLCQNCKSEDNDYMEKPCCDCSRCLGDIKRKGTTDKWEVKND
jgi:hypothetical protein